MNIFDCILEGIYDGGYPIDMENLQKKHSRAYEALPSKEGKTFIYGRYILFIPRRGYPMIWGGVPAHQRPVFDKDGNVVKMRDVGASGPDWHYYSEYSPEQKRELGWFPKGDRGPSRGGATQGSGTGYRGKPEKSAFAVDPEAHVPVGHMGGTASAGARSRLRVSQQAKRMREPDWSQMSANELQGQLRVAISKARGDERYQKVVHNIVSALEDKSKKHESVLRLCLLDVLDVLNESLN